MPLMHLLGVCRICACSSLTCVQHVRSCRPSDKQRYADLEGKLKAAEARAAAAERSVDDTIVMTVRAKDENTALKDEVGVAGRDTLYACCTGRV